MPAPARGSMLKHTIDSRKGWEIELREEPETIKHLRPGVAFIPGFHYSSGDLEERVIGRNVYIRALNRYTGKTIEMDNPPNWVVRYYDDNDGSVKYVTFSWESE